MLLFERSHMQVGSRLVGLFSVALPPTASPANALGDLYSLKHDLAVVLEWRGYDRYVAATKVAVGSGRGDRGLGDGHRGRELRRRRRPAAAP